MYRYCGWGMLGLIVVVGASLFLPSGHPAAAVDGQQDASGVFLSANAEHDDWLPALLERSDFANAELVMLDDVAVPGVPFAFVVPLGADAYTLDLHPESIRADDYQLLVQQADGSIVPVEPDIERTFRGTVREVDGAMVAASVLPEGLFVRILLDENRQYWMEPVSSFLPDAPRGLHVVYEGGDVRCREAYCGMADEVEVHTDDLPIETDGPLAAIKVAEVAADADVEYYNRWGQNVQNVQARITTVINSMNVEYERDVEIRHIMSAIVVRTAEPDPYSSSNSGTLLAQFQAEWVANQGHIHRDVAKLFTNRAIQGSIIGQAWTIGSICSNSTSYCYSWNDFNNVFSCATDLAAHELGHLWNASHCNCPSNTMNPGITCTNVFHPSFTIPVIRSYRDTRQCLSDLEEGTTTLPLIDDFPSFIFNTQLWTGIDGAELNTRGNNEPSPPYSVNLDGVITGDELRSAIINTAGIQGLKLTYWYERTGGGGPPEVGEDLLVEYRNSAGDWVEVNRHPGEGPAMNAYEQVDLLLPAGARHTTFRFRFRTLCNTDTDDWFVDDVHLRDLTDRDPPDPSPMSFEVAPTPVDTQSITMTATEAVDESPPLQYEFDFTTGDSQGHDRGWNTNRTYADTALLPNLDYSYRTRARDALNNPTQYSAEATTATMIETPTTAPLLNATTNSVTIISIDSFSWLAFGQSGLFFDSTTSGGDTGINEWIQTTLDTAVNLQPDTRYTFRLKARNRRALETGWSPEATTATKANVPGAPVLSGTQCDEMGIEIDANGNPAVTVYAVQVTATDPNDATWNGKYVDASGNPSNTAVYQTADAWSATTVSGLAAETDYTFRVRAKNQDGVETDQGPAAARATPACGDCIRNPDWVCDGDVDGNGVVNPVDVGLVQAAFCGAGECGDDDLCQYDLDCNDAINPVDSGIVQSLFGACDPPRGVCD
jgi:hypothetical protein